MTRLTPFYYRRLIPTLLVWLGVLGFVLLAEYMSRSRWDGLLEGVLVFAGIDMASKVRASTPREVMEYLYELPVDRRAILFGPYQLSMLLLLIAATFVFLVEITGAVYVLVYGMRMLFEDGFTELVYHAQPIRPWLNLFAAPIVSFWLSVLLSRWWQKTRSMRSYVGLYWFVGVVAFLLLSTPYESSSASRAREPADLPDLWLHNLPGVAALILSCWMISIFRRSLTSKGLEFFPVQQEAEEET